MNRTMAYEAHLEQVFDLRRKSIDASTLSRAFFDYADDLLQMKTKGDIADAAAADLVKYALRRAEHAAQYSRNCAEQADTMEREGLA